MVKILSSFIFALFPLFALANPCQNGIVYIMDHGAYYYEGTLQGRGMNSPAEFQAYMIDLITDGMDPADLELSFTFNNATFDPDNNEYVDTYQCTGLIWTILNFGQEIRTFVFDTTSGGGGGEGENIDGDFPSFYEKSSRSLSSVINSFKSDVKETSLFASLTDWFKFTSYSTSCPDFTKTFDIMGQQMAISFNDIFCGETGELFFTVLKAVFIFSAVVAAIGIAFL